MSGKKKRKKSGWRLGFAFIKDYFIHSDEKVTAALLVLGIILCVVAGVVVMNGFSWWAAAFWAAITDKALDAFWICIRQFAVLLLSATAVSALKNHFIGTLTIRWRAWLSKKMIARFAEDATTLKRLVPELENPAQRIQADIHSVVSLTLKLGSDLLFSILNLGSFIATLWVVGGTLSTTLFGFSLVIPGYLVWAAMLVSLTATVISHLIAKKLSEQNQENERAEADFRQELQVLHDDHDAENIAQEHAQNFYKESIGKRLGEINQIAASKLQIQNRLMAFQSFYGQASSFIPDLLSIPLYFAGLIQVGEVVQIGVAFGCVNSSLSWIVNSYEDLANYRASIERIIFLKEALKKSKLKCSNQKISVKENNSKDSIEIKNLSIQTPGNSSTEYMIRKLNLSMKPGEHLLIKGRSGLGKSTLFKVLSNAWNYGDGRVRLPSGKRLYFLPQKPTLPKRSLMAVLAYPEPVHNYSEEQYIDALKAVGGLDSLIPKLKKTASWSNLSGGEKQLLSFARAILKRPDWLFLDEATAAMDNETEARAYTKIKALLPHTTLVSIGHRNTVEPYHDRVLTFDVDSEGVAQVKEKGVQREPISGCIQSYRLAAELRCQLSQVLLDSI